MIFPFYSSSCKRGWLLKVTIRFFAAGFGRADAHISSGTAYDNTKRIDEVFMPDIRYAQNENVDRGDLRMEVIERGTSTPIDDAKISISYSGDPDSTVEEVNIKAGTESVTLDATSD